MDVVLRFCFARPGPFPMDVGLDGGDYVTHYGGRVSAGLVVVHSSTPLHPVRRGVSGKIDFLAHVTGFCQQILLGCNNGFS